MPVLILVRHGQADSNVRSVLTDHEEGFPLTDLGKEQVRDTAAQLSGIRVDRIFTSPLLRARQTAEILGSGRGLRVLTDERLWERRFGALNNATAVSYSAPAAKVGKRYDWRFDEHTEDGIEPFETLRRRIDSFVSYAIGCGGTTLAVSHGDTINALLTCRLGLDDLSGFAVQVPNASITVMASRGTGKIEVLAAGMPVLTEKVREEIRGYEG